jgi:rhodanese-related sulfurtransferase
MGPGRILLLAVRDAALVASGCAALALGVNLARAHPLPLVAKEPYQILVPCPVAAGAADELAPGDPAIRSAGVLLVDARSKGDFALWHAEKALSVPYDFLDRVPEASVRAVIESGAGRVVIYGDGGDPDSGRELAKELAARGVRSVAYLKGGAPALRRGAP